MYVRVTYKLYENREQIDRFTRISTYVIIIYYRVFKYTRTLFIIKYVMILSTLGKNDSYQISIKSKGPVNFEFLTS